MRWKLNLFGLLVMVSLVSIPQVHADTGNPITNTVGWVWNSITGLWDNWFGGRIIESSLTAPTTEIAVTDYNKDQYQKIITPYVTFELPKQATHYWTDARGDNDLFEVILSNVTVDNQNNILRLTWNAPRYTTDTINIDYNFKLGTLAMKDIVPRSKTLTASTKFNNFKAELGTLTGYSKEQMINESCREKIDFTNQEINHTEELQNCSFILVSPTYSWRPYVPIVTRLGTFTAVDDVNLTACGTLSTFGENYTLNQSIKGTTGSCIVIANSSITLDGNGYTLIGSLSGATTAGISMGTSTGRTDVKIKNFARIGNFSYGLNMNNLNSSLIYNNTFSSQVAFNSYAIYINSGFNNSIYKNVINWNATGASHASQGIYLISQIASGNFSNNNVTENNVTVYSPDYSVFGIMFINYGGTTRMNSNIAQSNIVSAVAPAGANPTAYGITFTSMVQMDSNFVNSNNILVYADSQGTGLRAVGLSCSGFTNSTVTYNTINTNGNYAFGSNAQAIDIYMTSSSSNNFYSDNVLMGRNYSINFGNSGGINDSFINVTYGVGIESVGTNAKLTRGWWYSAYVNGSSGNNIAGVNVSVYNNTGQYQFNLTTGVNGLTPKYPIIDYINNAGTRTYYSLYNNTADAPSIYPINFLNQTWNVTLQQNNVQNFQFTNPGTTISLTFTPSSPQPYLTPINASCSSNGDGTLKLYRDGVDVTATENNKYVTLGAGTYNYICNITAGVYPANSTTATYTVTKNPSSCSVQFNPSTPQNYPTNFYVWSDCSSTFNLYRNGTLIANNSLQTPGVGTYNFTVIRTDQQNYSNIIQEQDFILNQGTNYLVLTSSNGWAITASSWDTITGTCPAQLTCNLYEAGVLVSNPYTALFPAGSYVFNYNSTGNANYSYANVVDTLVSSITPPVIVSNGTKWGYCNNNLPGMMEEVC